MLQRRNAIILHKQRNGEIYPAEEICKSYSPAKWHDLHEKLCVLQEWRNPAELSGYHPQNDLNYLKYFYDVILQVVRKPDGRLRKKRTLSGDELLVEGGLNESRIGILVHQGLNSFLGSVECRPIWLHHPSAGHITRHRIYVYLNIKNFRFQFDLDSTSDNVKLIEVNWLINWRSIAS